MLKIITCCFANPVAHSVAFWPPTLAAHGCSQMREEACKKLEKVRPASNLNDEVKT